MTKQFIPDRDRLKAQAIALYKSGSSLGKIAQDFSSKPGCASVTRNMILGWVTRADITPEKRQSQPAHSRQPDASMSGFRELKFDMKHNQVFDNSPKPPAILYRNKLLKYEPEPIGPLNAFPETPHSCLYTKDEVGFGRSWRFCGHSGYPYCEFHMALTGTAKR